MYHQYDPAVWTGATGFYQTDYRSQLAANESETWAPVSVWAEPAYSGDAMYFSMRSDSTYPPPADREYLLELLQVPDSVTGAPAVGTVWTLPLNETFTLTLPTYRTTNGLEGYQFGYTVAAVPEPTGLLPAAAVALLSLRRRRRPSVI